MLPCRAQLRAVRTPSRPMGRPRVQAPVPPQPRPQLASGSLPTRKWKEPPLSPAPRPGAPQLTPRDMETRCPTKPCPNRRLVKNYKPSLSRQASVLCYAATITGTCTSIRPDSAIVLLFFNFKSPQEDKLASVKTQLGCMPALGQLTGQAGGGGASRRSPGLLLSAAGNTLLALGSSLLNTWLMKLLLLRPVLQVFNQQTSGLCLKVSS